MQAGDVVTGVVLVRPAPVPDTGEWWLSGSRHGDRPVWVRLPAAAETPAACRVVWERLRHLDHPALPTVVSFDEASGALAVAAPAGVALGQLITARHDPAFAMNPGTVLDAGNRLADALVHAHERGRPHGHLDPGRVWLTADGALVVWGFGDGPGIEPDPVWCPPERARGARASGDADQWALGAILAALVTGRLPWTGADPAGEARVGDASHLSGPVVEQWKPLGRLVERALQAEPRDRFSSIHPMRQALHAMAERVRQPSALAAMGAELAARFGVALPDPMDPPAPPDVSGAPGVSADAALDERPTVVDEVPAAWVSAPADASDAPTPAHVAGASISPSDQTTLEGGPPPHVVPYPGEDEGADTHLGTIPTRVPLTARDLGPPERLEVTAEPELSDPGGEDGPATFGDVAVADRVPLEDEPVHTPPPSILLLAPWVVGAMGLLLVYYLVLWAP